MESRYTTRFVTSTSIIVQACGTSCLLRTILAAIALRTPVTGISISPGTVGMLDAGVASLSAGCFESGCSEVFCCLT